MKGWTREKIGFALSALALSIGSLALFTDHWFEGKGFTGSWNAGFIKMCAMTCTSYRDVLSIFDSFSGKNTATIYVFCVIFIIYLPLIWLFCSVAMKGYSMMKRPSTGRDAYAGVFIWFSVYHGTGLLVCFIAMSIVTDKMKDTMNDNTKYSGTKYQEMMSRVMKRALNYQFGWSAYFGLIALCVALISAIISMPTRNTRDTDEDECRSRDTNVMEL